MINVRTKFSKREDPPPKKIKTKQKALLCLWKTHKIEKNSGKTVEEIQKGEIKQSRYQMKNVENTIYNNIYAYIT